MTDSMTLPAGQHYWEESFVSDAEGRPVPPRHQTILLFNVKTAPSPDAAHRLESALQELETRYEYGPSGLLTVLGWGPEWFEQFTAVESPVMKPLAMAKWENPRLETFHGFLHLASDSEENVTSAVDLLFGSSPQSSAGDLEIREIRRGFVGAGLPSANLPHLDIPKDSPLLLGFRSVYRGSQAPEENITITEGPFAGGTTAHVSRIVLDVDRWHSRNRDEQSALMHAPTVSAAEAEALVDDAPSDFKEVNRTVSQYGILGHAQAAARARVDNVPLINRRDFATIDDGQPGTHFVCLQRDIRDFNSTRAIMNGSDSATLHRGVGPRRNNGINSVMTVTSRANFLVPPRALRAYPLAPLPEKDHR